MIQLFQLLANIKTSAKNNSLHTAILTDMHVPLYVFVIYHLRGILYYKNMFKNALNVCSHDY